MIPVKAYAAAAARQPLAPFSFTRREPGPRDVLIDIRFCGICHSDLHCVRNEWGGQPFPCVPGHEIAGIVARVGAEVTRYKPGDRVGVGCMVDSCGDCDPCRRGLEQHCEHGTTWTYGSSYLHGVPDPGVSHTMGGYSTAITVTEDFVVRIPDSLPLDAAAPMLCAGITMYSPLRRFGAAPGKRVGIVGLGGLGHMGVKIASALGAEVTLVTTSANKAADARRLGAEHVLVSTTPAAMRAAARSLDLIIDTVAADHDVDAYLQLLGLEGALVLVGVPASQLAVHPQTLTAERRIFTGSTIGGVAETQEMLNFCAAHGVQAEIEIIAAAAINTAYERLLRSDVRYRFVIDASTFGN
jgi:uncharacterized zinc-type alcohol dehydrogenase-like protein